MAPQSLQNGPRAQNCSQGGAKWCPKGAPKTTKKSHFGGPGAQVRRKGAPGGIRAPPEVQNGAQMTPKSIEMGSKIEELNDKRCPPSSEDGSFVQSWEWAMAWRSLAITTCSIYIFQHIRSLLPPPCQEVLQKIKHGLPHASCNNCAALEPGRSFPENYMVVQAQIHLCLSPA